MHNQFFNIRNRIFTAALTLAAIFATCRTDAATSMVEYGRELSSPKYFEIEDMPDLMQFFPPPPGWTSPLFAGDYAAYLWGKTVRPTERGKRAVEQAAYLFDEISVFFSKPFGMEISREKTPAIYKVLYKSLVTAMHSYIRPKKTYARKRPFVRYGEGTPFPEEEELLKNNGSYPSGHTVRGWCFGLLAAEINPARQNELLKLDMSGAKAGSSSATTGKATSKPPVRWPAPSMRGSTPATNSSPIWPPRAANSQG
ncbi:MAG: hypothetical protein IIW14_09295 [Kiritimatiellae bacterium]|nr:hypothetical protein [Kiritimatiellia bacterium]